MAKAFAQHIATLTPSLPFEEEQRVESYTVISPEPRQRWKSLS